MPYPIIAVEIGVSEPLTNPFQDAEKIFAGTNSTAVLFILINVTEHGQRTNGSPWGLTDKDICSMKTAACLGDKIRKWHHDHCCPLVGNFTSEIYFYWRDMGHRPPKPLWTYQFSPDGPMKSGTFVTSFNFGPFLTDSFRLRLCGKDFELPLKQMEIKLKESLERFEIWRAYEFARKKWEQLHGKQQD